MSILEDIVIAKKRHVEECKKIMSIHDFEQEDLFSRTPVSLRGRLIQKDSSGIIAEFKRKSPSKGIINDKYAPEEISAGYQNAGVAGVSILTDEPYFGGNPDDLIAARKLLQIPVLRKEFIIDEYQIFEAKAIGADLILLIASILSKEEVKAFASRAKSLGLEILFEIHDREELEKASEDVTIVGVNNRNLKTFEVDIQQSLNLSNSIPAAFIKISESGIDSIESISALKAAGYQGFLIGENFMKTNNPGQACKDFIETLKAL